MMTLPKYRETHARIFVNIEVSGHLIKCPVIYHTWFNNLENGKILINS